MGLGATDEPDDLCPFSRLPHGMMWVEPDVFSRLNRGARVKTDHPLCRSMRQVEHMNVPYSWLDPNDSVRPCRADKDASDTSRLRPQNWCALAGASSWQTFTSLRGNETPLGSSLRLGQTS